MDIFDSPWRGAGKDKAVDNHFDGWFSPVQIVTFTQMGDWAIMIISFVVSFVVVVTRSAIFGEYIPRILIGTIIVFVVITSWYDLTHEKYNR